MHLERNAYFLSCPLDHPIEAIRREWSAALAHNQAALGLLLSNAAPGVEIDEILLEANYHIKLHPGLYLMPDLQYIIRRSAATTYPNEW